MKHVTITEHGSRLGLHGARLVVCEGNAEVCEIPLNRIKTISISRSGVSFSSNLVLACAARGIKFFFLDFRGVAAACLAGASEHAVCKAREAQFLFLRSEACATLAVRTVVGKIRNQRDLLKYYQKSSNNECVKTQLEKSTTLMQVLSSRANAMHGKTKHLSNWREALLGIEGQAARAYWAALHDTALLPGTFCAREGRGAGEVTNQALNFGYAMLSSYVWQCLLNAGLEIYAGYLHAFRPGKPALVLDVMEEYRTWAVDRAVVKLRDDLSKSKGLTPEIKRQLAADIHIFFDSRRLYHGKRLRIENILQRQIYRLSAQFLGEKEYKPYIFPW